MTSPAFAVDAARALAGPEWLQKRRTVAAERFAAASLPSTEEEVWRYSRIADLDLDRYALAGVGAGTAHDRPPLGPSERAGLVVVRDGIVIHAELDASVAAAGVFAGRLVDHPDARLLLGSVLLEPTDVFSDLNDAFAADPVAVVVPPGVVVEHPIVVVQITATEHAASFPRLVVHAGADSDVRILEHQRSSCADALVVPVAELRAEPAARLGYANVQQLGAHVWQVGSQVASAGASATLMLSTAALGGDYARVRTDCRLEGRGSTGNLASLYFGDGGQTLDFRTFQDHIGADTTSNLLFKGVVADHSRSVYTGLIRVRKHAHGSNALQTNRNIKLSDDAWAESVPNLEIENNDVRCSHASAVGPIDEDQRFYLESRGVPPHVAERLVVAGFFADVLDALPVAAIAAEVRAAIGAKLDRRGS